MNDRYRELLERISKNYGLSVEDIERRVEVRRAQFSGLHPPRFLSLQEVVRRHVRYDHAMTRPSRLLTLIGQIRRRSLLANLRSVLERIPFRPLHINCFYVLEYDGIPPPAGRLLRGRAEVRSATLDDLEGLTRCQNSPLLFRNRFRSNDHCVVAVVDGRIIAYQWFCDRPLYLEERYGYKIEIPADGIYAYDIYVVPEYRLAGIWVKFHSLYLRELMQRLHRRKIIGIVDYGNRLAMNTHRRFGFRIVGVVFVIKTFSKVIYMRATPGENIAWPRWASFDGTAGTDGAERPEARGEGPPRANDRWDPASGPG